MTELNSEIVSELFTPVSHWKSPKKESLNELRDCYEKYTNTYISSDDFKKGLKNLGYHVRENSVKLRMNKDIRNKYFSNKF